MLQPAAPHFLFYPCPDGINALVLNEYAGTLALTLLYILAMFGWGSLLLTLFPSNSRAFWNDFAARLIAGCGILYSVFIGLSVGGQLHRVDVGVVLGIGVLA